MKSETLTVLVRACGALFLGFAALLAFAVDGLFEILERGLMRPLV